MGGRLKVTALLAGEFGFGGNEVARASCFEHCGPIFRHQCWQGLQYSAYIESTLHRGSKCSPRGPDHKLR